MKKLLLITATTATLLLVGAMLLPSKVTVSRSILIATTPDKPFGLVNNMQHWRQWSAWATRDPAMQYTYSDQKEGKGAWYAWDSRTQGQGKLTVTESVPDALVRYTLAFEEEGMSSTAEHRFEAQDGQTRVVWTMQADMGYNPINRIVGLFMDGLVGPDFEEGLANLKQRCEG